MRILTAITLVLLFSGAGVRAQYRCGDNPTAEEAVVHSDAVFVGTVADVEWRWNALNWSTAQVRNWFRWDGGYYIAPGSKLTATLSVETAIKGQVPEEVTVHTYPSGRWCGLDFQIGNTYLVYAHRNGWQLWSGSCARSGDADDLAREIEAIKRASGNVPQDSRLSPTVGPARGLAVR